jgi:hypothetical protein
MPAPGGAGGLPSGGPPSGRGHTTIEPLAVERLAVETARRKLGGSPRATAHLDGHLARLEMSVSLPYPAPVRPLAADLRNEIVAVVADLAEVDVRELDVVVSHLDGQTPRRRRVR